MNFSINQLFKLVLKTNITIKNIFKFNGFSVSHGKSSMGIGTDAIVLGSWACVSGRRKILDVGSGSGVISLILASRIHHDFNICAIDIHEESVKESLLNFENSPWKTKLNARLSDFNNWDERGYDLIISNPPYFEHGPFSPCRTRAQARHQKSLFLKDLLIKSKRMLNETGTLDMILPFDQKDKIFQQVRETGLSCKKYTWFRSFEHKPFKRILLSLSPEPGRSELPTAGTLTQYNKDGSWHEEYIRLAGNVHHPDFIKRKDEKIQTK